MNKNTLHSLLQNMAVFNEVAKLGSFSQAADALQMTLSSVSKRISQLEDKLGTKLLERTTRSMRLTSTGEVFLRHCQNMLNEATVAVEIANIAQESLSGDIRIGVPKAFANHVLNPILMRFFVAYPEIKLHVVVTDNNLDLLRENIDCAIEITQTPSEYLVARPLMPVRQVLCATPQYLQANTNPIDFPMDLQHHECITLGETPDDNRWQFVPMHIDNTNDVIDTCMTDRTVADNSKQTVTVSGRYAVNHTGMRLQGVLNHLGVGCLPDFVVKNALLNGDVIEVLPDWRLQSKYQGMAWLTYLPNKFQTLRIRTLIEFLNQNTCT